MKTLLTLGLLVLACSLSHSSSSESLCLCDQCVACACSAVFVSSGPVGLELLLKDGCCHQPQKINIPKTKVKHVQMTPSGCSTKAIIVTSKLERKFCLDPDWARAKKLLQKFEESLSVSPKP
uniref:Chemokine interleukin-8-like domain-containing protein n=1 Tax=Oryzias latipes TaxID=8090 RepID=A0A3B3HLZ8_ORYLA